MFVDMATIKTHIFSPTANNNQIIGLQSANTRALTVGFLHGKGAKKVFVPGRELYGAKRCQITYEATLESLKLPHIKNILKKYPPQKISTVTVLRETLACRISDALDTVGVKNHFGDAFIGATHIKDKGPIRTAYLYENIEGLVPDGLWVIGESFCTGRNLFATMTSLLKKYTPAEILFIAPIASRRAIEYIDGVIAPKKIPTTYVVWGGLFGVDSHTLYDMPWGHKDTEPIDTRDQQFFIKIYNKKMCVGGDFGNNYYSPGKAKELYHEQLKVFKIKLKIPTVKEIFTIYSSKEVLTV